MKKYRALVPIVLIVLMVTSWYVLINDTYAIQNEYNTTLAEARKYAENGITKYAIEKYNHVLEMQSSVDIYAEVADYYKSQGLMAEYQTWSEGFFELYPTEPKAYDRVLDAYLQKKDYDSCYDILQTAQKRSISTDFIKQTSEEIKYSYKLDFNTYTDVSVYSSKYCPVGNNDLWGYVDRFGKVRIACKYNQVGAYTQTDFAPVVNGEGEAYFIDKSGEKVLVSKEKYQRFGLLLNNMMSAQREDGKYTYVDTDFNVLFGEYDYASTMNFEVGAVKVGDAWQIIGKDGLPLIDAEYLDVKMDEKEVAYRNDRLFVSTADGEYIMIDKMGNQIGSLKFEDAKVFAGDAPTAVKIDGQWCFVDANGALISDQKYDDARAFSNDLAAVCVNGKWGFVDRDENIVIDLQFFDARDFNEKGSCFVKTGDRWQLLKLYRLNREG